LQRRDRILPLLWPEKGQKSARNSLSNMLYHIRKSIGKENLITRGTEELGIYTDNVWCDALAFEELIEKNKMLKAVNLYRSDLLKGLHVTDASPEFDQWLEWERERFRSLYGDALKTLGKEAEEKGAYDKAVKWWELKIKSEPFETDVVRRLVELLTITGKRAEAIRKAKNHADYLNEELGIDPQITLNALTADLDKDSVKNKYVVPDAGFKNDQADFKSIAVLPFEELGSNEETSNFASGLHNDLLTRLSGVSALTVISRTSVLQYRNTSKPISKIAKELGAGTIVEGSVQRSNGRVRLNIQLIDVLNDKHIWAETYDRELTVNHLFEIQSELALKITESLKARLTPSEKKRVIEWAPTDNLEAYRLYTYGRKQLDQRTENGMQRAIEYFSRTVEQDPDHALAWTGLADALALQFDYGYEEEHNTLPKAEKAVYKALELDEDLAEAYTSLGLLHSNRHQGSAAIRELKRAVELQPSYAEAHNWLSWNYQLLGKPVKALESAKKAVNLNPLSPEAVSNLSISYLYNGFYDEALSEAMRGVELQPDWGTSAFYQALALFELKYISEAKSVLQDLSVPWAGNGPLAALALCHKMSGDMDAVMEIRRKLKEKDDIFALGLIHAAFNEIDKAFECFQKVEYWDDWETLTVHHLFPDIMKPLKDDPRFLNILKEVNRSRGLEQKKKKPGRKAKPDSLAIAVLPFSDLLNGSMVTPFSAGLHNDLLTKLSRIDELTVISGDSVQVYKNIEPSISDVARELNVGTIVKGIVQQVESRLRLNVQLISTESEQIRWAETYDRELTTENLFNIQSDLAEKITYSLQATLSPNEKEMVQEKPTKNLEAYLLYNQGRSHLSQRSEQSILKSLNLFKASIKEDPDYANAWAGLAESLVLLEWYNYSSDEDLPDPMEAIQKALKINPGLGEAYCSLGIYHSYYQNGPKAITALEKCNELQPGYSEAYNWLGWMRMIMGDPVDGLKPAERAARLDPLSPYTRAFLAVIYLANGMYEKALNESMSARKIRPEFGLSQFVEGLSLYHLEKYSEAEFAFNETLKLISSNGPPFRTEIWATKALIYVAYGNKQEASNLLEKIKIREDYFCAGLIESALGNSDEAFKLFDKTEKFGPFTTPMCRYYFPEILEPIRNDIRYEKLLKKISHSWGVM